MDIHLDKKVITSAAIATAAVGALGALAVAYKKRCDARAKDRAHADATDADLASNIGPGEINPYVDKPTDPANQN